MPLGVHKTALMGAAGAGGDGDRAFGGIITQYVSGGTTYRVHTFRGSGKFTVVGADKTVDILQVAGGGGGGAQIGAGGGAGGVYKLTSQTVSEGIHNVAVGVGSS